MNAPDLAPLNPEECAVSFYAAKTWEPYEAAQYLSGWLVPSDSLVDKIRQACANNEIPAKAELITDNIVESAAYGFRYYIAPRDAVSWALAHGVEISPECREWYENRTKPAQAEPATQPGNRGPRADTIERRAKLGALLNEIERRAKAAGVPYSRNPHPGDSKQFAEFLMKWDNALFYALPDGERFMGELHAIGVRFKGGNQTAKGDKFYGKLFPEIQ